MGPLCRADVFAARNDSPPEFGRWILQQGMGGDPWKVAVCSVLLCRTRRVQAEPALSALFARWPCVEAMAVSDTEELEEVVRPCGLHRNRARQLQRMAVRWFSEWTDFRELPGVGVYVADAVGLFCFGRTDLASSDYALHAYLESLQCS